MRLLLFLFSLLFTLPSLAQNIKLKGLSEKDMAWTQNQLKDGMSPAIADKIIKELMKRSPYSKVALYKISESDFELIANVQKKIRAIKFVGRKAIGEIEALNAMSLKPNSRLDRTQLLEAASRLRELYGRSGYFNPVIKVDVPQSINDEADILVSIQENEPCTIDAIKILTANSKLQKKLNSVAKSYRKDIFSEKKVLELENEVEEYLQDKRFLSARLIQQEATYNSGKTKATLTYRVDDPSSFYVKTSGNSYYTQADLLRAANLDEFDRTSLNPAAEIAERIRLKYINSGFAQSKITFKFTADTEKFTKTILINVEEGKRVKIAELNVAGRLSRSPDYYSDFIVENSTDAIDRGYYVKTDIDLGLKNLITELNNQGYLRAKIQAARPELSTDRSKVKLSIIMDEGPLTQIKDIRFIGNSNHTSAKLLSIIGLAPNTPLRLNQLEIGLEKLKQYYRSEGHIEMGIENERSELVKYDQKGYEAKIEIKIYEGPKVYVREILVEGNTFTKDYVIRKEVNIDEGELLNPEKIDEAQKRLDKLNIFSRVEIRTLEANTQVSKRTLIVNVTERNPGTFRIGMGVTNRRELTLRGYSGISYSNIGGKARAVSIRGTAENNVAETDFLEYEIGLGYLEPFLLDSKFRGRFNLSREEEIDQFIDNPATTDDSKVPVIDLTNKFSFLLERDITSKIKFTWNFYTNEREKRFFEETRSSPISTNTIITIGPFIDIDYRDNPFLPTSGHFTRFEADYSAPEIGSSSKVNFIRTQATFSYYLPLYKNSLIWANSIRGGYGRNLIRTGSGSGIPDSYAFFLGGYTTLRGYTGTEEDKTPTDSEINADQGQTLIIPGETSYHLIKSEIRFPIHGVFGGVVFYDAGAVSVQGFNANRPQRLKRVYGVGLRINTPVGPISLDYGKKVEPSAKESPDHFHLSIGTF